MIYLYVSKSKSFINFVSLILLCHIFLFSVFLGWGLFFSKTHTCIEKRNRTSVLLQEIENFERCSSHRESPLKFCLHVKIAFCGLAYLLHKLFNKKSRDCCIAYQHSSSSLSHNLSCFKKELSYFDL